MRKVIATALSLALVAGLVAGLKAAEPAKEVTLKGKITCGKCDLKVDTKCATVIQVKEGDKTVTYYFDPAGHKMYHGPICKAGKDGTVTGKVSEKDGKKVVTVSKLEWAK